jgi:hypothetical protein
MSKGCTQYIISMSKGCTQYIINIWLRFAVQSEIAGEVDRGHPLLLPPGVEHRPVYQVDELLHLLGKWQTNMAVQLVEKCFENTRRAFGKHEIYVFFIIIIIHRLSSKYLVNCTSAFAVIPFAV